VTTPDPFITVDELKTHLNKTGSADDAELAGFVSAACAAITERVGHVSTVSVTSDVEVSRRLAILPERPVVSVESVTALPSGHALEETDETNRVYGWTLRPGGTLGIATRGVCRVQGVYTAGRDPLPGNIRLAALELGAHLWRQSQLNSGGGRPPIIGDDQVVIPGLAYALPIRVRELLSLGKNPRDEILCG
jgi:hypothetical protein